MTSPNDQNHSSPWGRSGTQASRDWAQHGHRDVVTRLVNVYGARSENTSTTPADEPVRLQRSRRTARSLAVLVAVFASASAAHALGGAVFAGSGDELTRSVWQNPGRNIADELVTTPDNGAALTLAAVPPSTTSPPAAEPDDTTAIALPNVTQADRENTDRPSTNVAGDVDDREEVTGVQTPRGRDGDTSSPPNDDDDDDDQGSDDSDHRGSMSDDGDQGPDDSDHRGSMSDDGDQRSDDSDHRGSMSDHDDQRSDDSDHRGSMSESDSGSHSGRGGSKRPGD